MLEEEEEEDKLMMLYYDVQLVYLYNGIDSFTILYNISIIMSI